MKRGGAMTELQDIDKNNLAVFAFVKIDEKVLLTREIHRESKKWKMPGGEPRHTNIGDLNITNTIDFIKHTVRTRVLRETGIMIVPKEIVFTEYIGGHTFIVMNTGLDPDSSKTPKVVNTKGIKDVKTFSINEVKGLITDNMIFRKHKLALLEILK